MATNLHADYEKEYVNILSFDGGGIRGLIAAKIASHLESKIVGNLSDQFDIIAGTSTGGILALGLTIPDENDRPMYRADDLMKIYQTRGGDIFKRSFGYRLRSLGGIRNALFPSSGIQKITDEYFGEVRMDKCLTNTLITSYGIGGDHPVYFSNIKALHYPYSWNYYMKTVAQATGAAPVFFNPVVVTNDNNESYTLIDGGIVRNNPTGAAVLHAKKYYPNAKSFNIISIGTGRVLTSTNPKEAKNSGLYKWGPKLLEYIMDGTSETTHHEMEKTFNNLNHDDTLEDNSSYLRLQPIISKKHSDMTDYSPKNLKALEKYADDLIESHKKEITQCVEHYNYLYVECNKKNNSMRNLNLN